MGRSVLGRVVEALKAFKKKGTISDVTSALKQGYDVIFTGISVLS